VRNPLTKLLLLMAGYWATAAFRRHVKNKAEQRQEHDLQISTWEGEGGSPAPSHAAAIDGKA